MQLTRSTASHQVFSKGTIPTRGNTLSMMYFVSDNPQYIACTLYTSSIGIPHTKMGFKGP